MNDYTHIPVPCPECGCEVRVNPQGQLRRHLLPDATARCPGSNASTALSKLVLAQYAIDKERARLAAERESLKIERYRIQKMYDALLVWKDLTSG